jgi:hypothetical protein
MPGYDEHRRRAEIVAGAIAVGLSVAVRLLTTSTFLAFAAGSLCFVAITVGNLLPDVDSPTSIPRRRFTRLLQVAVVVTIVAVATVFPEVTLDAAERITRTLRISFPPAAVLVVGIAVIALAGAIAVPRVLEWMLPSHRGPLHDIRVWLLLVGGCVAVVYAFDLSVFGSRSLRRDVLVAATAGGLLVGIIVHLTADRELP